MLGVVALCTLGLPAPAGPWAREPGAVFVTYGVSAEDTQAALLTGTAEPDLTQSLFAEVGLGRGLTFGVDLSGTPDAGIGSAVLTYTFTAPESRWQAAIGLGATRLWEEGGGAGGATLGRVDASLGYGFGDWSMPTLGILDLGLGHQGGWVTLETTLFQDIETAEQIWQAEATFGLNLAEDWRGTLSVKAEDWRDDGTAVTVRSSIIYAFSARTALQLGGHLGVAGSDAAGLSLTLWQEF